MAQQQTYLALDRTGTQAAVYPSEEQLWVSGPTINDPGDQGLAMTDLSQQATTAETEEWLHEVLNGETSNAAYDEAWVNPEVLGPTGFGPWNDESIFQSGHSQNVVSNPASEQGWGVGPARRWAHFPHDDAPNPCRNMGQHMRNGQLPWVVADSSLYERSQLAWQQQWAGLKRRSPVAPIVPVAQSVPFTQTVPTFAGGPIPIEGVDVPFQDSGIW